MELGTEKLELQENILSLKKNNCFFCIFLRKFLIQLDIFENLNTNLFPKKISKKVYVEVVH